MEQLAYFTLTDRRGEERVTVCIGQFGESVAYGIAMRSDSDKWKTGRGRKLAFDRCRDAALCRDYLFSEKNFIQRREASKALHALTFENFERLHDLLSCAAIGRYSQKCCLLDMSFNEAVSIMVS